MQFIHPNLNLGTCTLRQESQSLKGALKPFHEIQSQREDGEK